MAEDLVQEILLKAYRAYDCYYDDGRLRAWLMRIAQNHLRNYFSQSRVITVSLDASSEDDDSLYAYLSDGITPEDEYLQKELTANVLDIIAKLPARQQQIITYRYIEDRRISEIAALMSIPEGSVKSASHYAIGEIRRQLGIKAANNQKGAITMDCKEIYKYLFIYANNTTTAGDRVKVEAHIKDCKTCADIVSALQRLIPTMVFSKEDELSHFLIDFPELHLSYSGFRSEIGNYVELNRLLEARGGIIPENENWFVSGYGKTCTFIASFDNEGNEIKYTVCEEDSSHIRIKASYIKKVFRNMWNYSAFSSENSQNYIKKANEAPELYYGSMSNHLGSPAKSALYQAVQGAADNIRIKRGNGVIDCGTYKFPYSDRYVTEDECISLDYSFNLKK